MFTFFTTHSTARYTGKILKPLCPVEFQFYSVLAKLASSDHEGKVAPTLQARPLPSIALHRFCLCHRFATGSGVTCEGIDEMKTRMGNVAVWEYFFPRFHGAAQTVPSTFAKALEHSAFAQTHDSSG